jgi:hypothetical protein
VVAVTAILCDICRTELQPRARGGYDWFSKGGVVVLVGNTPARLQYDGKDVQECCTACAAKCVARAWITVR